MFYDDGWNAYVLGRDYSNCKPRAWRDGWKDAQEANADYLCPEPPK